MGRAQGKLGDSGEGEGGKERGKFPSVCLCFSFSLSSCVPLGVIVYLFHVSPLIPPTLLSVFYF